MLYSDVQSIFDSTSGGICYCNHACKVSMTTPLDSEDSRGVVGEMIVVVKRTKCIRQHP